jgi:hypothetical protein
VDARVADDAGGSQVPRDGRRQMLQLNVGHSRHC